MKHDLQLAEISNRMTGVAAWLDQAAAHHLAEHRHLDIDTPEAAYWHAGYHQALADALRILSASALSSGTSDTSNPYRQAVLGGENYLTA